MLALLLAAALSAPIPRAIDPGKDYYFASDAYTSAEYLHLRADGRYVRIEAQHMYTRVSDTGRWRVEGGRLVMDAELAVRNIDAGEFRVYLYDRCGIDAVPLLRARVQELRDRGGQVAPDEVDQVFFDSPRPPPDAGKDVSCIAKIARHVPGYPAPPVDAERLDPLLAAIDAWLADTATRYVFEYEAWQYRRERFLLPMHPGMDIGPRDVDEVRAEMDGNRGKRVSFVLYAVSAKDFAKRSRCTYAFKFLPGMNASCNQP